MAKNPIIQKAREEGYNDGFKNGQTFGRSVAIEFFALRFQGLNEVKGIGPKTMELIVNHFGKEYFKEV